MPIPPTREEIAADIKAKITAKEPGYRPGEQIPLQDGLALHYEVHRVTISRAVKLLVDEGLLVSRGRRGVYVASGEGAAAMDEYES
jgi:DNA-binding GntR family transcriptional regulator